MVTLAAYARAIQLLLPRGRIWEFINNTFSDFIEGLAEEFLRFDDMVKYFLIEANPLTSTNGGLLRDWESIAYNPEDYIDGASESQRQAAVSLKLRVSYPGPSKAFFVSLAARLGVSIVITEGIDIYFCAGDECGHAVILDESCFVWVVNHDATGIIATRLKRTFQRLKPAHSVVSFNPVIDGTDELDDYDHT